METENKRKSIDNGVQQMMQDHESNHSGTQQLFYDEEALNKASKKQANNHVCLRTFLHSIPFQIFITLLTVFSLFSDDLRIIAFERDADLGFDIVSITVIILFLIEIVLSWIAYQEYGCSFFFFLDLISSLSILLDIGILTDLLENTSTYSISSITSSSRTTRVATRVVRIVKIFRIIRVMKLYKSAVQAEQIKEELKKKKMGKTKNIKTLKKIIIEDQIRENQLTLNKPEQLHDNIHAKRNHKKQKNCNHTNNKECKQMEATKMGMMGNNSPAQQLNMLDQNNNIDNSSGQSINERQHNSKDHQISQPHQINISDMQDKQSKISSFLSDLTMKKVILIVLLIMFLVPLFQTENYIEKPSSFQFITLNLHKLLLDPSVPTADIISLAQNSVASHMRKSDIQGFIVHFGTPFVEFPSYQDQIFGFQRIEDTSSSVQSINTTQIRVLRPQLTLRPEYEGQGSVISAVIDIQSYNRKDSYFSIARTIFVCIILIFLLHFFSEDINQLIVQPIEAMMREVRQMAQNPQACAMNTIQDTQYQTAIVHNAIVKIGALLSLVFGSAGAQIIGQNILKEGDMDPLVGGKKKCAIFGFCDIHKFTEVTELLQQDIMIFVNTISELIHSSVYRYAGAANKNIGQAFLLVWNIPDQCYNLNKQTNQIKWIKKRQVSILSDFSLLSFIKALVKINKDPKILEYRKDNRLVSHLGNDYKVTMGFGLHVGWAIQGAIGSEYKIDASYLSPNVNMASRLEAACKQFGVHILISEELYQLLTFEMKNYCRNIDRVTVKGSNRPIRLYTVDVNIDNISPPMNKHEKYRNLDDRPDVQTKREVNMQFLKNQQFISKYDADQFVKAKKQLREVMVNSVHKQFTRRFALGLQSYLAGKWGDSRLHFNQALKFKSNDGPTNKLLKFMKEMDFSAPETWKNYRELTSK